MLHFFNTQTLALLAVIVGFVVLCLGLWYVWTNQSQLRTEIQLLRSQQPVLNAASIVPTTTNRNYSNSEETKDILAVMGGTNTTTDPQLAMAQHTGIEENDSSNMPDKVVHRSQETQEEEEEESVSESSDSEYDDDDEDVTDEEENLVVEEKEQSADLVESLLSSIVTNAIDNSVEMQGGPSVIMNSVETPESNDKTELTSSSLCNADGEIGNESSFQETGDDIEIVQNTENTDVSEEGCDENVSTDVSSVTEELREHTVPQLKVMCQQHDIGVRRSNGTNKRKEELITDLVKVMLHINKDEGHETASNESVTAAGV